MGNSMKDLFQSARLGLLQRAKKTDPESSQTQATEPIKFNSFPGHKKMLLIEKSPLGLRLAANIGPRELQESISFCQCHAVTWNGLSYLLFATKVAGLCRDGAGGSCTPIKGCAQRARCGKLLGHCSDCLMDTHLPLVSPLSGTQAARLHSSCQVPWWWQEWDKGHFEGKPASLGCHSRGRIGGLGQRSGHPESCKLSLQQKQGGLEK